MGYTTDFSGIFRVSRNGQEGLDEETQRLINEISETRRVKRDLTKLGMTQEQADTYGVEGEFYTCEEDDDNDISVLGHNTPPSTQPGLWCSWIYDVGQGGIVWDQSEKFYNYIEWIEYLIEHILAPRGYIVNGDMFWRGEDIDDNGVILIKNNNVTATDVSSARILELMDTIDDFRKTTNEYDSQPNKNNKRDRIDLST